MIRFPSGAVLAAVMLAVPAAAALALPPGNPGLAPAVAMEPAPEPDPAQPWHDTAGLRLAGQLAAAGTYLAITPEQSDSWSRYCQALIGFMLPQPPAPNGDDAAATPAPLLAEQMANDALIRAGHARTLLAAASELRGILQPGQLARLARIEPSLVPRPGPQPDLPPLGGMPGPAPR